MRIASWLFGKVSRFVQRNRDVQARFFLNVAWITGEIFLKNAVEISQASVADTVGNFADGKIRLFEQTFGFKDAKGVDKVGKAGTAPAVDDTAEVCSRNADVKCDGFQVERFGEMLGKIDDCASVDIVFQRLAVNQLTRCVIFRKRIVNQRFEPEWIFYGGW